MCTICIQQPQIMPFSFQMSLISLNVYNFTSQPQIIFSSTQMTSNTLKYAQMHSTNSNHHSIATNMHSSIISTQITHLQPPNMYLFTYNAPISKPPGTNPCPKSAPMHLQHETPKGSSKHLNLSRSTL